MEWLNLHSSTLDSPEFVGAEPLERATWLCLLRFCIGQENGGHIEGCRDWTDRRWQQLCRVTKREVSMTSVLWAWVGDSLVVWSYPVEKESEVRRNRTNGALGGRPVGSKKDNPEETTRLISAETERKGKERKGKEGKEHGSPVSGSPQERGALPKAAARPESGEEVEAFFLSAGSTSREAEAFWDHYQANGWKQGGKASIKDWRAAARGWIRRSLGGARGVAAGLGGSAGEKNFEGSRGRGGMDQTVVRLPIAGLDVGVDDDVQSEGGAA